MMSKTGKAGEERAAAHISGLGMRIIARNWRCERGEIDIIARDGGSLVFIEVKARRSLRFGRPEEAIDQRKRERLRLLALHYINGIGQGAPDYRFDVVAVNLCDGSAELIRDAF
jgi:putative endonuclease